MDDIFPTPPALFGRDWHSTYFSLKIGRGVGGILRHLCPPPEKICIVGVREGWFFPSPCSQPLRRSVLAYREPILEHRLKGRHRRQLDALHRVSQALIHGVEQAQLCRIDVRLGGVRGKGQEERGKGRTRCTLKHARESRG